MKDEELLKNTGLFAKVSPKLFKELLSKIEEIKVPSGTLLIKEGDPADAFFVIKEGTLQVFTDNETILARLEKGAYFGEQALLSTTPGNRNASVRTLTEVVLLKVSHAIFSSIITEDETLKKQLLEIGFQQLIDKFKAISKDYDLSKYILEEADQFTTKFYAAGENIITQGDPPGKVFFILDGKVDIFKKNENGINEFISTIGPNNLIGEASLIRGIPRQATVVAQKEVKLLVIAPEQFRELYQKHPYLKTVLESLHNVFESPVRGEITQYVGKLFHMPAVISKFRLKDGREIISNKVIGKNILSIQTSKIENPTTYIFENKLTYRELQLKGNSIVSITIYGEWDVTKELYERLFNDQIVTDQEILNFKESGDIIITQSAPKVATDEEIICNCMYISRGKIKACINQGCTNVDCVSEKTGAGTICGSCIPRIQTMLGHSVWTPMHVFKIEEITPYVKIYTLTPIDKKPLISFKPGQHIVLQCEINGKWVERAFTLASTPGENRHYEIAVKMQEKGNFSYWFFQNDEKVPFVRVSQPAGTLTLDLTEKKPIICFTAGIGITPAVCFARSISEINAPRSIVIYNSSHDENENYYHDELESLSKQNSQIKYFKHITSKKGRMQPEDISQIAKYNLEAEYFICGPASFEKMVKSTLILNGINENKIIIERFIAA